MPVLTCAGLNDSLARSIIRDLKAGYGVEDIGRRGTATEEQARYVVEFMRKHGILEKMYQTKGKKNGLGQ